jgi:hypothetical protein
MSEVSDQTPNSDVSDETGDNKVLESNDSVKYDTFQKLLRQKKTADEKTANLEKELNEIRMKEEAARQDDLVKQQKFEQLSTELREKLEKEREEKEHYQKNLLDTHKLQAVLDKLPARPKKSEYLMFINLDKVQIDSENGLVAESVEEVANEFLQNHGELLQRTEKGLPSDAPQTTSKLTFEKWQTLPIKERKARMKEVFNKE